MPIALQQFARIVAFMHDPLVVPFDERSKLAEAFAESANPWNALSLLTPLMPEHPTLDPLREAIRHRVTPKSWALLPSGLTAALGAFSPALPTPSGLAQLLLEEALHLAMGSPFPMPEILQNTRPLVDQLTHDGGRSGDSQDAWLRDLRIRILLCEARIAIRCGDLERGRAAQAKACRAMSTEHPRPELELRLLELQAEEFLAMNSLALALARYEDAAEYLVPTTPLIRRFEILAPMAEILADISPVEMEITFNSACLSLLHLYRSPHAFERCAAVYREADLIRRLASRLPTGHRMRTDGVRRAAKRLEDERPLFGSATDRQTQALAGLCLARLYAFFDVDKAKAAYGKALELFDGIEDTARAQVVVSELDLVDRGVCVHDVRSICAEFSGDVN